MTNFGRSQLASRANLRHLASTYRTDATRMRVLNVTTPAPGRKARMRVRTFGPQPGFRFHRDAATARVSTIYRPMPTRRPCMSSCSCGRMCAAGKLRADGAENSHSTCASDGSSSSSRISSSTEGGRRRSGTLCSLPAAVESSSGTHCLHPWPVRRAYHRDDAGHGSLQ